MIQIDSDPRVRLDANPRRGHASWRRQAVESGAGTQAGNGLAHTHAMHARRDAVCDADLLRDVAHDTRSLHAV